MAIILRLDRVMADRKISLNELRITSYNVCYTKLLRIPHRSAVQSTPGIGRERSWQLVHGYGPACRWPRLGNSRRTGQRLLRHADQTLSRCRNRITSYNVCYTKLLRYDEAIAIIEEPADVQKSSWKPKVKKAT